MALGTLTIDLAANIARLQSDLGKANRLSEKYAEDQRRRFERAGKVIGTALAGLATGAFAGWIKESIDAADAARETAEQIGITVQAFQGLTFAASTSGVAQNELTAGLNKFNKSISAAAQGSKKQAQAFADIGVSVRDANGELKTADAVLLDVADKFATYEDGANKAALAQDLFGRSGAKLIPLLNGGRDSIVGLMEQAQRLGLVMSQESADAADAFNDQLAVLQGVSRGAANQIAAELLPTLNDMAGLLIEISEDSGAASIAADVLGNGLKLLATVALIASTQMANLGRAIGAAAAAAAAAASGEFAQAFEIIKAVANDNIDATETAFKRIEKLWSGDYAQAGADAAKTAGLVRVALERTTEEAQSSAEAAEKQADAIARQVAALEEQAATLGMTSSQVTLYKLQTEGATEAQLKSAAAALKQVDAYEQAQKAAEDAAALAGRVVSVQEGAFSDSSRALLDYQKKVETLREGLNSGVINESAYNEAVAGLDEQLNATLDKANETKDALSVFADEAARNMQGALADFFFDPFADGLDGMLEGFGKTMQRMVAEAAAAQLMQDIFGAVGKDGNRSGGWLSGLGSLFGGGRATGGPVQAGKFYEVGENNTAELFLANGRQYLVPGNSGSVTAATTGGTTQVFNINTPDANSFRASQRQIARRARQTVGKA